MLFWKKYIKAFLLQYSYFKIYKYVKVKGKYKKNNDTTILNWVICLKIIIKNFFNNNIG